MIPEDTQAVRHAIAAQIATFDSVEDGCPYDLGRLSAFSCLLQHAAKMPIPALLELCQAEVILMIARTQMPSFADTTDKWQGWADACAEVGRIIREVEGAGP